MLNLVKKRKKLKDQYKWLVQEVTNMQFIKPCTVSYDFEFNINNEFITKFIKSYAALDKNPRFTMQAHQTPDNKEVEIVMGAAEQHANKIKFKEEGDFILSTEPIPFPANIFKEIFSANKNATGKIYVSCQGLSKLVFTEDPISVTYFVARNNN